MPLKPPSQHFYKMSPEDAGVYHWRTLPLEISPSDILAGRVRQI